MKNIFKNIVLVILLLLSIQHIKAQTEKPTPTKVPDMLQNADYVFEGTVVNTKLYLTKDKIHLYSSEVVRIDKIIKGFGLKIGTIQVILEAVEGDVPSNDDEVTVSLVRPKHGNIPKIEYTGQQGIFVVRLSDDNANNYIWKDVNFDNKLVLSQGSKNEVSSIPYCLTCYDGKYVTPWGTFDNKKSLYQSFKQFNLKTDFIDRSEIVEDSIAQVQYQKEIEERKNATLKMQQNQKEYASYMEKVAEKTSSVKKKQNQRNAQAGGNLNIDAQNFTYSTNAQNQNFIEFDIYMWGTQSTFFDMTNIRYNYDKQIFGDSIDFRGGVTATKGTSLNTINYKLYQGDGTNSNFQIIDSVVYFTLGTNDSLVRPNRITLGTTPIQLMHLKFKIKNCKAAAKMQFVDKAFMDGITLYTTNANDSFTSGNYHSYDNIFRTDHSPITLCPITKITGFSPSVIRAGTGEILTITGKGFGNIRGKGQVLFPDADSLGRFLPTCDDTDYVSWNDTIIKVKVPSIVYADTVNQATAGSGKFKVKNNLNYRDSTSTNLDVEFAIETYSQSKKKVYWAYRNCQNSPFLFKLGNTLKVYPQAVAIIDSAINAWARFLNMDIRLQKDDTLGYQYFADNAVNNIDTISMIYVDNTLATGVNMSTLPSVNTCGNIARRQSSDIGIKMSLNWYYGINNTKPSGSYDFYSDILHELGHALGLYHIINPNATSNLTHELELMFWSETLNISKTASQRSFIGTGRQMDKKASLYIRDSSKIISNCSFLKPIREFTSPKSIKACQGTSAYFDTYIEQLAGSPTPTYQWQFYTGSGAWQNISALSSAPFNIAVTFPTLSSLSFTTTSALNKFYFRCVVGNVDGCSITSQPAKLTVSPLPIITTQPGNAATIVGSTAAKTFTVVASGNVSYQWYKGTTIKNNTPLTNTAPYSGVSTNTLTITGTTGLSIGNNIYFCVITDILTGCIKVANLDTLILRGPRRMSNPLTETKENISTLKIYPNPTNGFLNIEYPLTENTTYTLNIFNSIGEISYSKTINSSNHQIDVHNLPSGLYSIQLIDGNTTITKEIVIMN